MMMRSILLLTIFILICSSNATIDQQSKHSIKQLQKQSKSSGWASLVDRDSPFQLAYHNFRYFITAFADPLKYGHPLSSQHDQSIHQTIDRDTLQDILHFTDSAHAEHANEQIVTQSIEIDSYASTNQFELAGLDQSNNSSTDQSIYQSNNQTNGPDILCNYGQSVTFTRGAQSVDLCYCPYDMITSDLADCSNVRPFICTPRLVGVANQTSESINQSTKQSLDDLTTICYPPVGPISTLQAHDGPPFTPLQSSYRSSEFAQYDPRLTGIQPPCVATVNQPSNVFTFVIDCSFDSPAIEQFARPAQVQSLINQGYVMGALPSFKYAVQKQSTNQSNAMIFAVSAASPVASSLRIDWTIQNTAILSNKLVISQLLTDELWQSGLVKLNLPISQLSKGSKIGGRIHTVFNFVWRRPSPGFNGWTNQIPWKLMIEDSSYVLPSPPPPRKLKAWQGLLIGLIIGGLVVLIIYRLWMFRKDRKFQQLLAEQKASSKTLYHQTS